ncbi:histidinol-phosphate transaminase [Candidatus Lokiarchaeum ossiferum]|uniref:histidinol-phosphate transaminase n=1 Tax=Candidatus Lokiarchaeum ossiferum TaxID=2951803 RepID=UPI00352E7DC7
MFTSNSNIQTKPNTPTIRPRSIIDRIVDYVPPIENRMGKLRLDFNENTIGCSTKILEAIRELNVEDFAVYPNYLPFKQKLSNYLEVSPKNLLLTNGTDEAIKLVLETYLEAQDDIILPSPTFSMFEVYASIVGCKITKILYKKDLSFPFDQIIASITSDTKLVVLVNPNNPTGTAISEEEISQILQFTQKRNILVLIDEAYYQFYGKSAIKFLNEFKNLIILQTFSKAFGLAGIRLGYIISNPSTIQTLQKVLSPYSVNKLAIVAGSAALSDLEYISAYTREIRKNRLFLALEIQKLGFSTFPSQANFIVVNFEEKCEFLCNQLKMGGILTRNRSKYPLLQNCLRITIGTKYQCEFLLKEIKFLLDQWDFFTKKGYSIPDNLIKIRNQNGAWR